MIFKSPEIDENKRQLLYQVNNGFEQVNRMVKLFTDSISLSNSRGLDHYEYAVLTVDENQIISFEGFGQKLKAKPEYVINNGQWVVSYIFHLLIKPIIGDEKSCPLYGIEIYEDGSGMIGTDHVSDMQDNLRRPGHIYNQIKSSLLCVLEGHLSKSTD